MSVATLVRGGRLWPSCEWPAELAQFISDLSAMTPGATADVWRGTGTHEWLMLEVDTPGSFCWPDPAQYALVLGTVQGVTHDAHSIKFLVHIDLRL